VCESTAPVPAPVVHIEAADLRIYNSIVHQNLPPVWADHTLGFYDASRCDLEGEPATSGNIDQDPMFHSTDFMDPNLRVRPLSVCIDRGDNAWVPAALVEDLDGLPRFLDDPEVVDTGAGVPPIVDLGAYEGWDDSPYQCNASDLAEPFGVLDLSDIIAFIDGFLAADDSADLNDDGVFDLTDINLFIDGFNAGCP
jgi:hypothetical protein